MTDDVPRDCIAHAGVLKQACRRVPQTMETQAAELALGVPSLSLALVCSLCSEASSHQNIVKLVAKSPAILAPLPRGFRVGEKRIGGVIADRQRGDMFQQWLCERENLSPTCLAGRDAKFLPCQIQI